jgi:hypothetical protein
MTKYEEVQEMIDASEFHDWIQFANRGTWTYKPDVALRLSREDQLDKRYDPHWAAQIQGSNSRFGYYVYYADSPVEYHVVVSVDDGRAFIPDPTPPQAQGGQYSISPYAANVGRIITGDPETFRAYLNRTGIVIRE